MKSITFSSLDPFDIERLKEVHCAESFVFIFKQIMQSLYYEDCVICSMRRPVVTDVMDIFGLSEDSLNSFPSAEEYMRLYPSADAFKKLEKHFLMVERYVGLLKRPRSFCGRLKIRRKIRKLDYKLSIQEFYSAILWLFIHKGLGNIEDFKTLLAEE